MQTVLLIDDDPLFRAMLSRWLAEEGWHVVEAEDGEIGLVLAKQHRPRAVVCDLLMPRCNGFQLCRALRAEPEIFGQTKIIVTSGSGYASDRQNAMEAGADDYLVKPVNPSDLLARLPGKIGPETPLPERHLTAEEEGTRIRFWGVRGSIATPGPGTVEFGGNTACVEVRAAGEIIILDAGTGIRPLGLKLVSEFRDQPLHLTVLISHTHWDHIQGFPFFVPAYNPKNRVRILGFDGARKGLESTLSNQMESPYFPISMQQMPGNITIQELKDLHFQVGKVPVQATFMNHPGICVGYRLGTPGGDVAYIPDNELYQRLKTQASSMSSGTPVLQYAQTQDEKLIHFVRGVEVLIIDSQYDASEYPRHVGWGHSCVDDTVMLALRAGVKRLFLFHHDPSHDDAFIRGMVEGAQRLVREAGATLEVDGAREGIEIVLEAKPAPQR